MNLFDVAWHGPRDEQTVRVAIIDGEGDTIIDAVMLSLAHDTPTFVIGNVNNIFLIIGSRVQPIISQQKSTDRIATICARYCSKECLSAQVKMEDGLAVYSLPCFSLLATLREKPHGVCCQTE